MIYTITVSDNWNFENGMSCKSYSDPKMAVNNFFSLFEQLTIADEFNGAEIDEMQGGYLSLSRHGSLCFTLQNENDDMITAKLFTDYSTEPMWYSYFGYAQGDLGANDCLPTDVLAELKDDICDRMQYFDENSIKTVVYNQYYNKEN